MNQLGILRGRLIAPCHIQCLGEIQILGSQQLLLYGLTIEPTDETVSQVGFQLRLKLSMFRETLQLRDVLVHRLTSCTITLEKPEPLRNEVGCRLQMVLHSFLQFCQRLCLHLFPTKLRKSS